MKLTKKIRTDLAKAYQCAMEVSILDMKAPLRYINQYIAENVSGYGTAADEKVQSREDYRKMLIKSRQQAKGMLFKAKVITPYRPKFTDETTAKFHDEIVVQIGDKKNKHNIHLYMSCVYKYQFDKWQLVMFHGSMPDAASSTEDTFHVREAEKKLKELEQVVAQRTADLQMKTRELEIEASLERVRAVTMGMNKPGDILNICQVFFKELQSLGFADLRNTLINFWDDENGQLLDYDYSDFSGGNFAKLAYNSHPAFEAFQKKIRKAKDAFAKLVINKESLKSWLQRRRSDGEYKDPRLNKISALYYYFYSTGVGALGISTFSPISKDELEVLKKFRNVFDMAYQRYIDIQKAEEQAKEVQIELALERVRARTMAMQKSEELPEAANLLFQQVQSMGMPAWSAGYCTWNDDKKSAVTLWMSSEGVVQPPFTAPTTKDALFIEMRKGSEENKALHIVELGGNKLVKHYQYMRTLPVVGEILDSIIEAGHPLPTFQIMHQAYFSKGFLLFITYEPVPNAHGIFKRFAKVFDQTYTRFLDLQKAEAQAREAQIEAALEKVRSRSLAMHKSEELNEVVTIFFEKLKELHIQVAAVGISIYIEGSRDWNNYVCGQTESGIVINNYQLPYFDHKITRDLYEVRKNNLELFIGHYSKKEKDSFYKYVIEHSQLKEELADEVKQMIFKSPSYTISAISTKYATIIINDFEGTMLSAYETNIIKRFSIVFDQAYTRFLDLQKAEAQAREAQIEAALERVRSRSMAMHKSEELADLSLELVKQVQALGVATWFCAFNIYDDDGNSSIEWGSNGQGVFAQYRTPREGIFLRYYEAGQRGETLLINEIGEDQCPAHYEYLCSLPGVGDQLLKMKAAGIPFPKQQIDHVAFFKHGYLLFITYEPVPETHDIFKRFAKVFEQTYTRFLDLKKAEAQARESQIQLALERVRARTMAMHHSSELADTATILFEQIKELGFEIWSCGFGIWRPEVDLEEAWMSTGDLFPIILVPFKEDPTHLSIYEASQRGESVFEVEVKGKALTRHYDWLMSLHSFNKVFSQIENSGIILPAVQYKYAAFFKQGYLHLITTKPQPAIHDIGNRFAKVFEQTYTRFLDLQKAEAQAREAEIELGLERVRARAMAMQKSDELSDLVDTVFKELTKLDFALNWCIINIIDEPSLTNMVWAANPETNKPPESYLMKFEDYPFHHSMLKAYRERKTKHVYVIEGEEKKTYDHYLFNETEWRRVPKAAQDVSRAMKRYVATFTFSNFGGLQTVGEEYLSEQNLDILSRFGKVFDLTYTRFNDLQKAEIQAREAQIEVAVERVRAKALAMHKSAEIMGVAFTMRKELEILNMPGFDAATITLKQDDGTVRLWDNTSAKQHEDGTWENSEFIFRLEDNHPDFYLNKIWSSNDRYIVVEQNEHDLKITTDWVRKHDKNLADVVVHYYKENGIKQAWHPAVALTYGRLNLDFYVHAPEPEVENILIKMAAAFDLAYKRFLDLQKAEAQAREAQIEAALERVRSRTMAMQRSEELPEVAGLLFQQVKALGVPQFHCGFNIFEIEDRECIWYPGSPDGDILPPCKIPLTEHPVFMNFIESRKRGDELCVYEKEGEYQAGHYRYMLSLPVLGEMLQNMLDAGIPFPTFQIDHLANFSHGNLLFITSEHFPEMHDTFKRFAKVFEQTYIRFLDLQKAEAQAREAQIEAALEKVRSRSLAMQKPEELLEVAEVLRSEMGQLGVEELETSSIYIVDKEKMQAECWYAIKDIREENKQLVSDEMTITFADTWVGSEMGKFYRSKKEHTSIVMKGDNRKEWINYCAGKSNVLQGYYGDEIPERTYHLVKFNGGYMGAASPGDISAESWDLLRRAASVFSLAYTRFNDLQIAEAHARQAEQDLIAIKEAKQKAEEALTELQATQKQLIQAEKMASLGELTAGIAHEIQNPLNFVNNFSEVSKELLDEMKEAIEKGDTEDAKEIMNDVIQNLEKINHHGKRADGIVKGMLQHSSSGSGKKEPTDINALADEYLRLAYHGLRAKDKSFNATMKTNFDESIGSINIIPQDIGRVILNLITNAFYVVNEKSKQNIDGYEPTVVVSTKKENNNVLIEVKDNGNGIPEKVLDKIFQPFFTTKPTGQGTGLGLSLSYDIIKAHGGEIKVNTKENEGTEFTIQLPIH